MNSTPVKRSLRLTPRKSVLVPLEDTPKKVRFSVKERNSIKNGERVYTAEDALSMLNDSSLSDIETSSDEEWIITKSRASSQAGIHNNKNSSTAQENEAYKTKKQKEVVSPLKLLRKPEYEVNKLPSVCKKSESAVSPIVIKRKKEAGLPLTPSSKDNTAHESKTQASSSRRSRTKNSSNETKDDVENEIVPKEKKSQKKNSETPKKPQAGMKSDRNNSNKNMEKTLEEKINELCLQTPQKAREVETERIPIANVRSDDEILDNTKKDMQTPQKQKTQKRASNKVKDTDSEEDLPSPSKRRSLRTPKPKAVSSASSHRPIRKSTQKAVVYTEDSDMEIASPDGKKTPKRNNKPLIDAGSPNTWKHAVTPKRQSKKLILPYSPLVTPKKMSLGSLTPSIPERINRNSMGVPRTPMQEARLSLHTGLIPDSLPCREKEFGAIFKFLSQRISDKRGGCMYISGVPGTGKTATVNAVINSLKKEVSLGEIPDFDYIEINGLRLSEPNQAYVRIWEGLSRVKLSSSSSFEALEHKFNRTNKKPCVILIDELDYLCNKRQDVIYNILEWSTKNSAALSVLTIANTMDLPERTLKGKINSRMGLHKLPFLPYKYQELEKIVMDRIRGNPCFHPDAIQFVARKVAAVSGDARRALDICRRATELVLEKGAVDIIKVTHITDVMNDIFAGTRIKAIRCCSAIEKMILRAMVMETKRTGVEETTSSDVHLLLASLCASEGGIQEPPIGVFQEVVTSLASTGIILAEYSNLDMNRKISLNVSEDDIHYAMVENQPASGPSL